MWCNTRFKKTSFDKFQWCKNIWNSVSSTQVESLRSECVQWSASASWQLAMWRVDKKKLESGFVCLGVCVSVRASRASNALCPRSQLSIKLTGEIEKSLKEGRGREWEKWEKNQRKIRWNCIGSECETGGKDKLQKEFANQVVHFRKKKKSSGKWEKTDRKGKSRAARRHFSDCYIRKQYRPFAQRLWRIKSAEET